MSALNDVIEMSADGAFDLSEAAPAPAPAPRKKRAAAKRSPPGRAAVEKNTAGERLAKQRQEEQEKRARERQAAQEAAAERLASGPSYSIKVVDGRFLLCDVERCGARVKPDVRASADRVWVVGQDGKVHSFALPRPCIPESAVCLVEGGTLRVRLTLQLSN